MSNNKKIKTYCYIWKNYLTYTSQTRADHAFLRMLVLDHSFVDLNNVFLDRTKSAYGSVTENVYPKELCNLCDL